MSATFHPATDIDRRSAPLLYERISFRWSAVFAGVAVAMALDILFAQVALSLNLGLIRDASAETLAIGTIIFSLVAGLIALFVGAWVAGRLATVLDQTEGALHGVAVWAAGAVLMIVLAFTAAGAAATGVLGVAGSALQGAGKVAELAAPKWEGIEDELKGGLSQVDASEAAGSSSVTADGENRLRDRSRLFELARNHFAVDAPELRTDQREEMTALLAGQLGVSQQAAERTLSQWDSVWASTLQKYEAAKQEAARAAERARRLGVAAAGWAAFGMLLGAGAAMWGGLLGTRCRLDRGGRELLSKPGVLQPHPAT